MNIDETGKSGGERQRQRPGETKTWLEPWESFSMYRLGRWGRSSKDMETQQSEKNEASVGSWNQGMEVSPEGAGG